MNTLDYIPLYPRDFFSGILFLNGRQRCLYAYLLMLQADKGCLAMDADQIAAHTDHAVSDVQAVLDAKFTFDKELGGWVNRRMAEERLKAIEKLQKFRENAEKAREAKKRRVEKSRVDSKLSVKLNAKLNGSAPELAFATPDQASKSYRATCESTDVKRQERAAEIAALIAEETDPDRLEALRLSLQKYQ